MLVRCRARNDGVWRKAFAHATPLSYDDTRSCLPALVANVLPRSRCTLDVQHKPCATRFVGRGSDMRRGENMQRRSHSTELKVKIAVEALKGQKTMNELASVYSVHPNLRQRSTRGARSFSIPSKGSSLPVGTGSRPWKRN